MIKPRWQRIGDLPLLHMSFKYRANRTPVVAKGINAIGQFVIDLGRLPAA